MTWRVADSLLRLRAQVDAAWPGRSRASDGTIGDTAHASQGSASDHNPWVLNGGVGVVTALDLTHDPARGADMAKVAEAIVASRDPRVKYVIFNRRIVSSTNEPWKWRPYYGQNPHTAHLHVSVVSLPWRYDSRADWTIGRLTPTEEYWLWLQWILGEGRYAGKGRRSSPRPPQVRARVPASWWARLAAFLARRRLNT